LDNRFADYESSSFGEGINSNCFTEWVRNWAKVGIRNFLPENAGARIDRITSWERGDAAEEN
jgi:hypothetical protein